MRRLFNVYGRSLLWQHFVTTCESCNITFSHIGVYSFGLITAINVFSVSRLISSGSCTPKWSTTSMMMLWPNLEQFWPRVFWMQVSSAVFPTQYPFVILIPCCFFVFVFTTVCIYSKQTIVIVKSQENVLINHLSIYHVVIPRPDMKITDQDFY